MDANSTNIDYAPVIVELEKALVEAVTNQQWEEFELLDERIQTCIAQWVEAANAEGSAVERVRAQTFIDDLRQRYIGYRDTIVEMRDSASKELKNLQGKKKAINKYLDNK